MQQLITVSLFYHIEENHFKVVLEAKLVIFCTFSLKRNIKKYLPQKSVIFRANTEMYLDCKNNFSCSK